MTIKNKIFTAVMMTLLFSCEAGARENWSEQQCRNACAFAKISKIGNDLTMDDAAVNCALHCKEQPKLLAGIPVVFAKFCREGGRIRGAVIKSKACSELSFANSAFAVELIDSDVNFWKESFSNKQKALKTMNNRNNNLNSNHSNNMNNNSNGHRNGNYNENHRFNNMNDDRDDNMNNNSNGRHNRNNHSDDMNNFNNRPAA